MTKATPKKKTTVKAHRGFAHVPLRGKRRPVGDPRRPLTPRRRRRPPIQQPIPRGIGQLPRNFNRMSREERMLYLASRNPSIRRGTRITPAQRDRLRKQLEAEARRRQLAGTFTTTRGLGDRPRLPIRRRQREALDNPKFAPLEILRRRRRRPTGDPKPRKRPTTPKQKQRVVQATQAPRTRRIQRPV